MFIHVNGVRLFYEKQGTGKPLILLHGNEEDHRSIILFMLLILEDMVKAIKF